jgi:hypothetical protein
MSERGVFAVDRGIWDHPLLASNEPFTRREAWLWLVSEAAWKPRRRRVGLTVADLARGELSHSLRFLAEAWGWPKSNVARFLEMLKTETMIGTRTDLGITIITICKYDEYQRVSLPDRDEKGTSSGTQTGQEWDSSGTAAGQQRDKLEDTKNIKISIPRKPRKGNATPLPEGYLFPEKIAAFGAEQRLQKFEIDREHQKFCNHAKANDRRCVDWIAAERNWMLGAVEKLGRGPPAAPADKPKADWDLLMRGYTSGHPGLRAGNWFWGPEPGEPGCQVPPEIQRKHGFEPAGEKAA